MSRDELTFQNEQNSRPLFTIEFAKSTKRYLSQVITIRHDISQLWNTRITFWSQFSSIVQSKYMFPITLRDIEVGISYTILKYFWRKHNLCGSKYGKCIEILYLRMLNGKRNNGFLAWVQREVRRLTTKSVKVFKPRDPVSKSTYSSNIWHAHWHYFHRYASQISERSDNLKSYLVRFRGFERSGGQTSHYLVRRCPEVSMIHLWWLWGFCYT